VPKAKGWLRRFVDDTFPLYFQVSQTEVVVATNKNCDMVLEYITDVSKLEGNIPKGYPKPGRARFSLFLNLSRIARCFLLTGFGRADSGERKVLCGVRDPRVLQM
jgi:hypothetical protein